MSVALRYANWASEPSPYRMVAFMVPLLVAGAAQFLWVVLLGWWGLPLLGAGLLGVGMLAEMMQQLGDWLVDAWELRPEPSDEEGDR